MECGSASETIHNLYDNILQTLLITYLFLLCHIANNLFYVKLHLLYLAALWHDRVESSGLYKCMAQAVSGIRVSCEPPLQRFKLHNINAVCWHLLSETNKSWWNKTTSLKQQTRLLLRGEMRWGEVRWGDSYITLEIKPLKMYIYNKSKLSKEER